MSKFVFRKQITQREVTNFKMIISYCVHKVNLYIYKKNCQKTQYFQWVFCAFSLCIVDKYKTFVVFCVLFKQRKVCFTRFLPFFLIKMNKGLFPFFLGLCGGIFSPFYFFYFCQGFCQCGAMKTGVSSLFFACFSFLFNHYIIVAKKITMFAHFFQSNSFFFKSQNLPFSPWFS